MRGRNVLPNVTKELAIKIIWSSENPQRLDMYEYRNKEEAISYMTSRFLYYKSLKICMCNIRYYITSLLVK